MSWKTERGRVAALSRSRTPDDPELVDARRNLAVLRLEEQIRHTISTAPPFTRRQRDGLAALIRQGVSR